MKEKLKKLQERMAKVTCFFEARDEMNAYLHLQHPRYSPLTLETQAIRDELSRLSREN